jgi:V8-like Glu-specific endopeptidase
MQKLAISLLALLVLGLAATAAQARNVVGARVNPDPDAVRAYWTPERMRSATPKDVQRGGGPKDPQAKPGGGGGGGGGTGTSATAALVNWPTTVDLTYTNGKVYFNDGTSRYVCSGTAINSANASVVWTAGHCVNDGGSNRFYTNWMFVPAFNNGGTSYATFVAGQLYTSREWAVDGEFGKDYGAAVVGTQGGQTLQATLGGVGRTLAFSPNYTIGRRLDAYGYPAAGKYNGQSLWRCVSSLQRVDTASPNTMGIPCSMTGGSSGGAWLEPTTGNQVSNNSYGYSSLKNVMFGPVFGPVAADLFHTAEGTATPGTIVGD